MEIKIKISESWARNERAVMNRLHDCLGPYLTGPFEKQNGYRWQLDGTNDWWAELDGTELIIATRYSEKGLKALAAWAKFMFGDYDYEYSEDDDENQVRQVQPPPEKEGGAGVLPTEET